jgi:transcription termination factor Rho
VTDTTTLDTAGTQDEKPRRSGALSTMKVAELQGLAASMGITGTAKMRKGDLVTAIKDRQSGAGAPARRATAPQERPARTEAPVDGQQPKQAERSRRATAPRTGEDHGDQAGQEERSDVRSEPARQPTGDDQRHAPENRGDRAGQGDRDRSSRKQTEQPERQPRAAARAEARDQQDRADAQHRQQDKDDRQTDRADRADRGDRGDRADHGDRGDRGQVERRDRQQGERQGRDDRQQGERQGRDDRQDERDDRGSRGRGQQGHQGGQNQGQQDQQNQGQQGQGQQNQQGYDDDGEGRGGRRRNRNRNRNRDKRGQRGDYGGDYENEPMVEEDDVLVPVAGILDVLDNYAFVRTSGYLPGSGDVYVPLGMVKKNGMRKGDAITGAVKAQREDQQNQRQKFNALVRLDTVNGMTPEDARKRVEFGKLTPLYPQQRLRLETDPSILTTRVIDLVAPIGKGQRGLIVAPAKAGKTMVMQAIANAITTNNPECHLMVVLVDERPEEVTDMQRAVKGEVISSTFDRPAEDHTTVAELAIERAKRLVEMGHDVVVLLDSITKLGRAYNLSAPASGRILSGGVDSAALYPPKKFFGAARNIENGGSLTILATALVETGSRMDEVIFEEFKGTGNMELKLDRGLSNRRIFPAVDVNNSGTRKEELLLSGDELKIMWKLRRVLAALDNQQGIELLIDRLKKTKSNVEFLMQVQQNSSIRLDEDKD